MSKDKIVIGCPMCGKPTTSEEQFRGGCDVCDGIADPITDQIDEITKALQGPQPYELRIEMMKKYRELVNKKAERS